MHAPANEYRGNTMLKDHAKTQLLGADDQATLRDDLENSRQSEFEIEAAYSRRFIELAETAYPPDQRNDDQHRVMVRAYARGLRRPDIARKLIEAHRPTTLDDAVMPLTT